jgi:hypothetical protein
MDGTKIVFVILHTTKITKEKIIEDYIDCEDSDIENLMKVFAMMDGQKAIMCTQLRGDDELTFLGIADNQTDKEVAYLLEQDSFFGAYIDQRDSFDEAYDSGEYSREVLFSIHKQYLEIIPQEQWEELVAADQEGD